MTTWDSWRYSTMSVLTSHSILPSGRRSAKSRAGCSSCKQRRIKCDEKSPSCGPCLKKGLRCPGLLRLIQWSQKHETLMNRCLNKACSSVESTALSAPTNEPARKSAETESNKSNHAIQFGNEHYLTEKGILTNLSDSWDTFQPSGSLLQYLSPSPPTQFQTQESILSDYYFSVVCPINSCFDSLRNPLRSYVGAVMYTCPLIFQCVMAMSAAHLFQKREDMMHIVLDHRKTAIALLTSEMELLTSNFSKEVSLLGSILLGMTSSWHNASSIDLVPLQTARILFKEYAIGQPGETPQLENSNSRNHFSFTVGMMAYWEATVSFLFDQGPEDITYLLSLCHDQDEQLNYPNPWSGISDRLFVYMAQAGALSRQKVLTNRLWMYISSTAREEILSKQHRAALELVQRVRQFRPPSQHSIQDPGDNLTPLDHLLRLAQVYKLSILLQLFLSFPELMTTNPNVSVDESILNPQQEETTQTHQNSTITLAATILNIMATIPEDSRTNIFLTLPLIIAGSALQLRTNSDHCNSEPIHPTTTPNPTIERELGFAYSSDFMIHHWRSFVRNRLQLLHNFVALEPISRASQLLELVWNQSDASAYDNRTLRSNSLGMIHWMEVMIEARLESIFG